MCPPPRLGIYRILAASDGGLPPAQGRAEHSRLSRFKWEECPGQGCNEAFTVPRWAPGKTGRR